ncbi:MAG TPA: hypothetical protein VG942_04305 [Hyphomonadaceae bacterium]|nr:hypothetical protein [Hyphomonadaceae bacterium]
MTKTRSILEASLAFFGDPGQPVREEASTGVRFDPGDPLTPDPYADEPKWPAWKVTVFVIVFCAAFWAGIAYLAMRLMG